MVWLFDEIHQWEQEDPNQVHQVPIQANVLDCGVVFFVEFASFGSQGQPQDNPNTNHNV
jgi:Ulp1 family protease